MQVPINLKAGVKVRPQLQGVYLAVLDVGSAVNLEISVYSGSTELEHITTVTRGLTLEAPARFDRVELKSDVDCVVQLVVSEGRVRIGAVDGANVNATIVGQPVHVSNDRGAPGAPVYVVGLTYSDAPAAVALQGAAVAVTSAGALLAAADVDSRSIRFYNQGPDPVAIGPAGGTWANRAKVLEVGDGFIEDRGGNLAWYGVTDAGKTASVGVERVKV